MLMQGLIVMAAAVIGGPVGVGTNTDAVRSTAVRFLLGAGIFGGFAILIIGVGALVH